MQEMARWASFPTQWLPFCFQEYFQEETLLNLEWLQVDLKEVWGEVFQPLQVTFASSIPKHTVNIATKNFVTSTSWKFTRQTNTESTLQTTLPLHPLDLLQEQEEKEEEEEERTVTVMEAMPATIIITSVKSLMPATTIMATTWTQIQTTTKMKTTNRDFRILFKWMQCLQQQLLLLHFSLQDLLHHQEVRDQMKYLPLEDCPLTREQLESIQVFFNRQLWLLQLLLLQDNKIKWQQQRWQQELLQDNSSNNRHKSTLNPTVKSAKKNFVTSTLSRNTNKMFMESNLQEDLLLLHRIRGNNSLQGINMIQCLHHLLPWEGATTLMMKSECPPLLSHLHLQWLSFRCNNNSNNYQMEDKRESWQD